jgi:hypothetical protein
MFGSSKRIAALEARLEALEASTEARVAEEVARRMAAATGALDAALERVRSRVEADPEDRTRFLLNAAVDDLRRELEAALEDAGRARAAAAEIEQLQSQLKALLAGDAGRMERQHVPLGEVRRAEQLGFVAAWFEGGWNDRVLLRVGWSDPPERVVCKLNTVNDINSFAAAVVRPGEYWVAETEKGDRGGVKCVFTPFL